MEKLLTLTHQELTSSIEGTEATVASFREQRLSNRQNNSLDKQESRHISSSELKQMRPRRRSTKQPQEELIHGYRSIVPISMPRKSEKKSRNEPKRKLHGIFQVLSGRIPLVPKKAELAASRIHTPPFVQKSQSIDRRINSRLNSRRAQNFQFSGLHEGPAAALEVDIVAVNLRRLHQQQQQRRSQPPPPPQQQQQEKLKSFRSPYRQLPVRQCLLPTVDESLAGSAKSLPFNDLQSPDVICDTSTSHKLVEQIHPQIRTLPRSLADSRTSIDSSHGTTFEPRRSISDNTIGLSENLRRKELFRFFVENKDPASHSERDMAEDQLMSAHRSSNSKDGEGQDKHHMTNSLLSPSKERVKPCSDRDQFHAMLHFCQAMQGTPQISPSIRSKTGSEEKNKAGIGDDVAISPNTCNISSTFIRSPTEFMRAEHRLSVKADIDTLTESSFSSVSSFLELTGKTSSLSRVSTCLREKCRSLQPTSHPFFWRSHPKVTVTSYDEQRPRKAIRDMVPLLRAPTSAGLASSIILSAPLDFPRDNYIPRSCNVWVKDQKTCD